MQKSTRRGAPPYQPTRIESLEQRIAPATFTVTSLDDSGIGSLREAIAKANATEAPDLIIFERGLEGNILLSGPQIDITEAVTVRASAGRPITIVAIGDHRIFDVADTTNPKTSMFSVSGLVFLQGDAGSEKGGAIRSQNSIAIRNCSLAGSAAAEGGAIFVEAADGSAAVTIANSEFTGNTATSGRGGAVLHLGNGATSIKSSTFSSNRANAGGAVAVENHDVSAFVLANSALDHNTATAGNGGGVDSVVNGAIRIAGTDLYENRAGTSGGAVNIGAVPASEKPAGIVLENLVVWRNQAGSSGGGINIAGEGRPVNVARCTISANECTAEDSFGGGLLIHAPYDATKFATATITHTQLIANTASTGGGASFEHVNARIVGSKIMVNGSANGNFGTYTGGGISYFADADSTAFLRVESSIISGNQASEGGGLSAWGRSVTISKSNFLNNSARSGRGGGAFITAGDFEPARLVVGSSVFSGNNAGDGGGLYYAGSLSGGTPVAHVVNIQGTQFTRNHAEGSDGVGSGGGLYLLTSGATVLNACRINENISGERGGGLHHLSSGATTMSGVVISNNTAELEGGGAFLAGEILNSGKLVPFTFINVKFEGNQSLAKGGGISADTAAVNLVSSTVTRNVAGGDGGLSLVKSKLLRSGATVIAENKSLIPTTP